MNLSHPDINSEIYKQYIQMIKEKVGQAEIWLISHGIDYIWNYWAGNHLYRIYIPKKDVLLDFEYYPINNIEYSYIRINFDDDIISLLENLFPTNVLDTQELEVYKLNQRATNRFLRENKSSPVYDKNVLRLGYVRDNTIYQCMILKDNKIIRNVTKTGCRVTLGTFILLRQFNETFGISEILIKENLGNSYANLWYQAMGVPEMSKSTKKKIWWNRNECKWKIKKEQTEQFIPFYYCEDVVYRYGITTVL